MRTLKHSFHAFTVFLVLSISALAQQTQDQVVLWQDRGDLSKLDMINGPGGEAHQPGAHFRFRKETTGGTSPKFEIEDENGVRWKVKLGEEAKPETAATRLLWAAGYSVDEDYYRSQIVVDGLQRLKRGQKYVHNGNVVTGVRLERHRSGPDPELWSWFENPFSESREFNGLRVMMALINNWDLKDINNDVYMETFGEVYVVSDLGAALGRTGGVAFRSKGNAMEFAEAPFIHRVQGAYVDFVLHSRPFFLRFLFDHENYVIRTRMEKLAQHIPVDDARWLGNYLGQLSADQLADCFRASGFSSSEVEIYSRAVTRRIAELKNL